MAQGFDANGIVNNRKIPTLKVTQDNNEKVVGKQPAGLNTGPNASSLEKLFAWVYPPDSEYYWYREGLIAPSKLSDKFKNMTLYFLLSGMAGSGVLMGVLVYGLSVFLSIVQTISGIDTDMEPTYMALVDKPWFFMMMCLISGSITVSAYYFGASRIEKAFNNDLKGQEANWKCQPNRQLSELHHAEEVFWGCLNAFVAGVVGMGMFMYHLNHPFLKFYYDVSTRGWLHFAWSFALVFFWIDIWAYWAHRTLHKKIIYKHIHKWHHRYLAPTAFSSFAMHPLEFVFFQTGGVLCCMLFEIHIMAFFAVVSVISYHGQVDHSGIWFEGEFPWQPSTMFHDNHHEFFHTNFGQNLVLWDWVFGTLRKKKEKYGEDVFVG